MMFQSGRITAVFSHPNHEIAIFCLLQRLKPRLIYLTDGGGEKRIEQTRQGLKSIDLLDQAQFLGYSEKSLYEALLDRDLTFYKKIVSDVRGILKATTSRQIFCDAIEFYNPVHDMSLPIVRAAVRDMSDTEIFEVPLVYQKLEHLESYELQKMPPSRRGSQIEFPLSEEEHAAKASTWERIYTTLVRQMGSLICRLPSTEVIAPACSTLPQPGMENVLRYEWRAQLLMDRGEIDRKITYAGHYLPMATSLMKPIDGTNN